MGVNPASDTKNTESVEYRTRTSVQRVPAHAHGTIRRGRRVLLRVQTRDGVSGPCAGVNRGDLPSLTIASSWVDDLRANPRPKPISELTPNTVEVEGVDFLIENGIGAGSQNRYSVRWIPLLQKFRGVRCHVYGFSSRRDGVWPLTSIFRFTIEAFLRIPSDLHRFIALSFVNSRNS